jgi:hypothetical protein
VAICEIYVALIFFFSAPRSGLSICLLYQLPLWFCIDISDLLVCSIVLLFISSKLSRCARCVAAQGVPPLSEGNRETGSHWVSHARMGVANSCVCCKPVAEGGAGVGLRVLRGARNRSIIRYGDQEFGADASPYCVATDARPRGGAFPLTHETRCFAGGGWGGSAWSLVLVGESLLNVLENPKNRTGEYRWARYYFTLEGYTLRKYLLSKRRKGSRSASPAVGISYLLPRSCTALEVHADYR